MSPNHRAPELTKEIWVFLAAAAVSSAAYLHQTTGESALERSPRRALTPVSMSAGQRLDVGITLISPDSHRIACAADEHDGAQRCAFAADGITPTPASKPEDVLVPYMTVDNVLIVIPGLWQEPALAKRLKDEPADRYSSLAAFDDHRFTATCSFTVVKRMGAFGVRWNAADPWARRDFAYLGHVSGCRVADSK